MGLHVSKYNLWELQAQKIYQLRIRVIDNNLIN